MNTYKKHIRLTDTLTTGKKGRYYVDGVRVPKARYENIAQRASMYGTLECFKTQAWPTDNGGIKRKNWSIASY